MAFDREIVLNLAVRAAQFNQGISAATKGLATVKQEAREADKTVKGMEGAFSSAGRVFLRVETDSKRAAQGLSGLAGQAGKADAALDSLGAEAKQSSAHFDQLIKVTSKLEAALASSASEFKGAAAEMHRASGSLKDIADNFGKVKDNAKGSSEALGSTVSVLKNFAIGAAIVTGVGAVAAGLAMFGKNAIAAAENINTLKGSISAIVAANETVTDSSGRMLTGVDKIRAVQTQVAGLFKQLQVDALKTSDTTEGLITKFSVALGPGLAKGMSLDQIRQLTVAASVAMSALKVDATQAASEMRSLLTGDQLDNAQLARGLGIANKAQWDELAKGGKLFENLSKRMGDFVAAGDVASRGLTGIVSSLDDFRQKLMAIAGEKATEALASGFGELLDMVQNADGSLTPLGNHLVEIAQISGQYVTEAANDFVWLTKKIAESSESVLEFLRVARYTQKSVGAKQGQINAFDTLMNTKVKFDGQSQTYEALRQRQTKLRSGWQIGLTKDSNEVEQARELGRLNATLAPYDREYARITDPNFFQNQQDSISASLWHSGADSNAGAEDKKGDKTKDKFTFKPKPLGNPSGDKGKKGQKDPRIAELLKNMRREIQVSNAQDLGLSGEIPILTKYLGLLKQIPGAHEEITEVSHDRVIAQIGLAKKHLEMAESEKKKLEEIALIEKRSDLKISEQQAQRALSHTQQLNALEVSALKARYSAQLIDAKQYYRELTQLQSQAVLDEIGVDRGRLTGERGSLVSQLTAEAKRPKGKYDPKAVATIKAGIREIDDQLEGLNEKQRQALFKILNDNGLELTKVTKDSTADGLRSALGEVFSGLNLPIADSVQKSVVDGILKATKGTSVGDALAQLFGSQATNLALGIATTAIGLIQMSTKATAERFTAANALGGEVLSGTTPDSGSRARAQSLINMEIGKRRWDFSQGAPSLFGAGQMVDGMSRAGFEANLGELQKQMEAKADEAEANRQADSSNSVMGAMKKVYTQGKISRDEYLSMLKSLSQKTEEIWDEIAGIEKEKWDEVMEDAHSRMAARLTQEEAAASRVADAWVEATDRMAEGFQKLQEAQEAALAKESIARTVQAIYGNGSGVQASFENTQALIKLKESQIADIGSRNNAAAGAQGGLLGQYASNFNIGVTSSFQNKQIVDSKGNVFDPGSSSSWMAEYATFADDMELFKEWKRLGLNVYDKTSGAILGVTDFENAKGQFTQAQSGITSRNAQADSLRKEIESLRNSQEVPYAQLQKAAGNALTETTSQAEALRYANDPRALMDFKKRQVDLDIGKRYEDLKQSGVLSDLTDNETQNGIRKNLEEMRTLLKAQIDKDGYSDSNPMPVRVVEGPPVYTLPDSSYFRKIQGASIPNVTVNVSGSNLSPAELEAASLRAVKGAIYQVTKEVNRENTLSTGKVSL